MNLQINLEAFRNGDGVEFKNVLNFYKRRLFYLCKKIVDNEQEAEDIVIKSLTKAFQKCKDFDTVEKLNAFIYKTTVNACLTYIKSKQRGSQREKEWLSLSEETIIEMGMFDYDWTSVLLMKAIEALPDSMRTICKLHYKEDYSVTEIMKITGKERRNILNQLAAGRKRIKLYMAGRNNHS